MALYDKIQVLLEQFNCHGDDWESGMPLPSHNITRSLKIVNNVRNAPFLTFSPIFSQN